MTDQLKTFYDKQYTAGCYAVAEKPEDHSFYPILKAFIDEFQLHNKKCLEIGCGRGAFQDMVADYTGVDISETVANMLHKPFCRCSATELPFENESFNAVWTQAVLEHVPRPEKAMLEIRRVLKHNGFLLLAPAWQCRPWAAMGYSVRPYRDFDFKGKIVKLSIPLRNSVLFRSMYVFPRRLFRTIQFFFRKKPVTFKYRKLNPNYDHYWVSDSDALNSMDPYDAILWFISRGDICISYPRWFSKLFVRTGPIIFQKTGRPKGKNDH
ncbi:hypothetical protein ES703_108788 [subsurface metagenome]